MNEWWHNTAEFIHAHFGLSSHVTLHLLYTVLIILCAVAFSAVARRLVNRRFDDPTRRYFGRKTVVYAISIIALLLTAKVWFGGGTGIATYLGILSAGLAVALADPVMNLAGWFFIIVRRPLAIGDRIQIGETAGDVIDIRLFQFSIIEIGNWVDADQSTGRIIHIPNGHVFKQALANYTQGFNFIWNELSVTITFESNWAKAKRILQTIADENNPFHTEHAERQIRAASEKFLVFFKHLTPIVWTRVADSGVTLTIRYLCEPRKRRSTESIIWENILTAFAEENDIDLAYPTQRYYFNPREGKPQTGGPAEPKDGD